MIHHRLIAALGTGLGLAGLPLAATAQPISQEEAAALREEIARLKASLARMESRLGAGAPPPEGPPAQTAAKAAPPATAIGWKGSPQFVSEDRAFKVKGRIQADYNYVQPPKGSDDRGFGFSNEMRRIRLGGEGKLGGGIGYKLELELSDNSVDLVDTFVTYETSNLTIAFGNQNQFQSLDELIGDTSGTFMERAAFTDAFAFERRLGLSAQYRTGDLLVQGGLFSDDIGALANDSDGAEGGDENNSIGGDLRLVYAPKLDRTQFHFGGSAHRRQLNRLEEAGTRYRQRPYLHSSNSRPLATPSLAVRDEFHYGVEAAAMRGPWHAAAEAHWLRADRVAAPTAAFFGAYAEIGYFLTQGDSRSYKNGIFGTTAPKRSIRDGGPGSIQVNLRYDYLDLDSHDVRGGRQNAYLAAIIWSPIEYLRINLNYGYLAYEGAAILSRGDGDYGLQVAGARLELDF